MNKRSFLGHMANNLAPKVMATVAATAGLLGSSQAEAFDSFFDIFVDISDEIEMTPDTSGAFPFPPPPLDFPNQTIDIEMVSLSLESSSPVQVSPQPLANGDFHVDSFFDIHTEIRLGPPGTPPQVRSIDSFFDIHVEMEVDPTPIIRTLANGDEERRRRTAVRNRNSRHDPYWSSSNSAVSS